jgi:hypothetical protein
MYSFGYKCCLGVIGSNQTGTGFHAVRRPDSADQPIRERADIEDGDRIRWRWRDGELSVEVVRQRTGVFADFERFEGENKTFDHDRAGLEPASEYDAKQPLMSEGNR